MGPASKDLLPSEKHDCSAFPLESSLFICQNKDSFSRNKLSHRSAITVPVAPVHASQVLGRVKDFLGVISKANRRLEIDAKENPGNYDIEVLEGNESGIIKMDIMLGVADLHTPEANAVAESSIAGYKPVDSLSACSTGTDLEDSSDDDEDDDDDSDGGGKHGTENTRVLGELRKHDSQGDESIATMGKNRSKKQSETAQDR